jgi:ubiquinone/menaquinone biosynthesis C-methylase UbiE
LPDSSRIFSKKAESYARYRWDYPAEAIETIVEVTGISRESVLADIGAGTGILTKVFLKRAGRVYAIEPNPEMRALAVSQWGGFPSFQAVDALADATTLPDQSIDVITVGQAIHWFPPESFQKECMRILKPGGWLAIFRYSSMNEGLSLEDKGLLSEIFTEKNGYSATRPGDLPEQKPMSFYFRGEHFTKQDFYRTHQESWEEFLGALHSVSNAPDPNHPAFENFVFAAKRFFDQASRGGQLETKQHTELFLGQIQRD